MKSAARRPVLLLASIDALAAAGCAGSPLPHEGARARNVLQGALRIGTRAIRIAPAGLRGGAPARLERVARRIAPAR